MLNTTNSFKAAAGNLEAGIPAYSVYIGIKSGVELERTTEYSVLDLPDGILSLFRLRSKLASDRLISNHPSVELIIYSVKTAVISFTNTFIATRRATATARYLPSIGYTALP